MKRSLLLLPSLALSACQNAAVSSSVFSPLPANSYYESIHYRVTDPESTADQVILIIYSETCSHCLKAEPLLEKLLAAEAYRSYTKVAATSAEVKDGYYVIGKTFAEAADFYYAQPPEYVGPYELTSGYPTPSLMYLKKSRQLTSMLIGVGGTEEAVEARLELLVSAQ